MKITYTTDEGEVREVEIPMLDLNWEYERGFLNLVPCPVKGYPDVLYGNFKYNEDECEHQSITEYYEGYQCNECGKWFTYDEDITDIHKQRLQERIEIYKKHKEFDAEFRKVKQKISEKEEVRMSKTTNLKDSKVIWYSEEEYNELKKENYQLKKILEAKKVLLESPTIIEGVRMNKYLVALCTGGIMEDPKCKYENFQVIEAKTPDEARQTYNKVNGCSYFYGYTLCEYDNSLEWLITHGPIDADVVKKLLGQKLIEDEDE